MSTQPQSYSIGWICTLKVEFVAACELLDEEFSGEAIPNINSNQDPNIYTFGRVGVHYVVVTCLPFGQYGISSAAHAASHLLRSFPSIRIGLMVGIGGGAGMLQHDIRLGDVVVSTPGKRHGGVMPYDFGKVIQGREFEDTGYLMSAPIYLLTALQRINALHKRKGHNIAQKVNKILENKRLSSDYACPGRQQDMLFKSNYVHIEPPGMCDCARNWEKIGPTVNPNLIPRSERNEDEEDDPKVHYGLIASADKIMKDANVRDSISAKHNILCFETEAAGLMNHFPCLVIRGISDYSDSHKNDQWQAYAAATAAAYAKELLETIPAGDMESHLPVIPQRLLSHDNTSNIRDRGKSGASFSKPTMNHDSYDLIPKNNFVTLPHPDERELTVKRENQLPFYPPNLAPLRRQSSISWMDPSYGYDRCLNSADQQPLMVGGHSNHALGVVNCPACSAQWPISSVLQPLQNLRLTNGQDTSSSSHPGVHWPWTTTEATGSTSSNYVSATMERT